MKMVTFTRLQNLKYLKEIFCLCLVLCAVWFMQSTAQKLVGEEMEFVLNYHNGLRKSENAANMMELQWSNKLATKAYAWAENCNFMERKKDLGENMAFNINPGSRYDRIKNAMDAWYSEKQNLMWKPKKCGPSCHYTQLVWAKTSKVGCAVRNCTTLKAFGKEVEDAFFFVCFYKPKGNFGKRIYQLGEPCSKCPKRTECKDNLCVKGDCADTYDTEECKTWAANEECTKNSEWMNEHCKKSCKLC